MDTHEVGENDQIPAIDLEKLKEAFAPYENELFGLPDDASEADRDASREARHQQWLTDMREKLSLPSDTSETEVHKALRTQFLADRGLPPDTSDKIIAQIRRQESDDRYLAMDQDR